MSPVSPFLVMPGVCAKRCQMLGPAPSASGEPSIWYAEVALPQRNAPGKTTGAGMASGIPWMKAVTSYACDGRMDNLGLVRKRTAAGEGLFRRLDPVDENAYI